MTRSLCALVFALLLASPLARADIRVIQLQHRPDNDMIRLLQPLLGSGERVAGNGQQLILQADSSRLDELEQLISTLDTPLRRLLILVDNNSSGISSERGIDVQGRIRGREGKVVLGEQGARGNRIDIRHYSTSDRDSGLRSIQTLEGSAAFIQTGQLQPRQQWAQDQHGRASLQTVQRELSQGFYVTPTVQGNRVTLALDSRNDNISRNNPDIIEQHSLSTRISGSLNEWIDVGAIDADSQHDSSGITSNIKSYSIKTNNLRIKVQLLDEE